MEVIEKHVFVCPTCKKEYITKHVAINCMNSNEVLLANIGDIVECGGQRFGWYDGDKDWIVNINADRIHELFKFYYVVTHIEYIEHRVKYHLYTMAMSGDNGYRSGYTYNSGHYTPKLIDAPEIVKEQAKTLIGLKANGLL